MAICTADCRPIDSVKGSVEVASKFGDNVLTAMFDILHFCIHRSD